jgi:hypothetical protein
MDEKELALIAYTAYGRVTDFKNFQGNPMPQWAELPEKIQEAWIASVQAVLVATAED